MFGTSVYIYSVWNMNLSVLFRRPPSPRSSFSFRLLVSSSISAFSFKTKNPPLVLVATWATKNSSSHTAAVAQYVPRSTSGARGLRRVRRRILRDTNPLSSSLLEQLRKFEPSETLPDHRQGTLFFYSIFVSYLS